MNEKILIVGDLHLIDKNVGLHKDYWGNCLRVLEDITKKIKEEKVTRFICLGDWFGVATHERNLKTRKTLSILLKYVQEWVDLTGNPIYTVKGNHDIGSRYTDYQMMIDLGYMQNPDYLDVGNKIRLHFINYGDEERTINLSDTRENIGLIHSNITIQGGTDWYYAGESFELSNLRNLEGITYLVAGHIHYPSPRKIGTTIGDKAIELFYPGCPTRPSKAPNLWEKCYYVSIEEDKGNVIKTEIDFPLSKIEDTYYDKLDEVNKESESQDIRDNIDRLSEILSVLHRYNANEGLDYITQIKTICTKKEVADLAIQYLEGNRS